MSRVRCAQPSTRRYQHLRNFGSSRKRRQRKPNNGTTTSPTPNADDELQLDSKQNSIDDGFDIFDSDSDSDFNTGTLSSPPLLSYSSLFRPLPISFTSVSKQNRGNINRKNDKNNRLRRKQKTNKPELNQKDIRNETTHDGDLKGGSNDTNSKNKDDNSECNIDHSKTSPKASTLKDNIEFDLEYIEARIQHYESKLDFFRSEREKIVSSSSLPTSSPIEKDTINVTIPTNTANTTNTTNTTEQHHCLKNKEVKRESKYKIDEPKAKISSVKKKRKTIYDYDESEWKNIKRIWV